MAGSDANKLYELVSGFDTAMLITQSLRNELRARPMAIAEQGDEALLRFATRADEAKLDEIRRSPQVAVTMQSSGQYVSISGTAIIRNPAALAEELWSSSMRLWFPDGPGDSQLRILEVDPHFAEIWDRTGMQRLEFWWEAGKALLKGEQASAQDLRGHTKLRL